MRQLIPLGEELDQSGKLGGIVCRGGLSDGLGGFEFWHRLPMLFDGCGGELMLFPIRQSSASWICDSS
jgi:hypothetical protein